MFFLLLLLKADALLTSSDYLQYNALLEAVRGNYYTKYI